MKNDLPILPTTAETIAASLLYVPAGVYRCRLVTSCAIHLADPDEWHIEKETSHVIIRFPRGRILDSQNRAWLTAKLRIVPAQVVLPYSQKVNVSSLGDYPRYYVQLPRACSLTFESVLAIKP